MITNDANKAIAPTHISVKARQYFKVLQLTAILLVGSSYGEQIIYPDYNFGRSSASPRAIVSTFFGLYADRSVDDKTTAGNIQFLRYLFRKIEKTELPAQEFREIRRLKLIGFKSVFVSIYQRHSTPHDAQFVLNDLEHNARWRLNNFAIDDFNSFVGLQMLKEPYDYVYLAKLFLVLTQVDRDVYFVNDSFDIFDAFDKRLPFFAMSRQAEIEMHQKYGKVLHKPSVEKQDTSAKVTLVTFDVGRQVLKHVITFQGTNVANIESSEVIPQTDIEKLWRFVLKNADRKQ